MARPSTLKGEEGKRAKLNKTHYLGNARPFALTGTTVHNVTGTLDCLLATHATLHKQQVIPRLISRDKVDQLVGVFLCEIVRLGKTQGSPFVHHTLFDQVIITAALRKQRLNRLVSQNATIGIPVRPVACAANFLAYIVFVQDVLEAVMGLRPARRAVCEQVLAL